MLAREIVREAGIAQAPANFAQLENDKARAEFFKTLLLLDTALLAGAAAVAAVMPSPHSVGLVLWSFALIVLSMCGGFLGLHTATMAIGQDAESDLKYMAIEIRTLRGLGQLLGGIAFMVALVLFIQFVLLNLPSRLS